MLTQLHDVNKTCFVECTNHGLLALRLELTFLATFLAGKCMFLCNFGMYYIRVRQSQCRRMGGKTNGIPLAMRYVSVSVLDDDDKTN